MAKQDSEGNSNRKMLSDYNMEVLETQRIQENLRYLGFLNAKHGRSKRSVNLPSLETTKNKNKRKIKSQKENFSGNAMKAPSEKKTFEVRKKENRTFVSELASAEGKALKGRMPENSTSPDAQDTKFLKANTVVKDPGSTAGNKALSPDLSDLILKSKKNKICRPPNAFMLFAKEHRRAVGKEHPEMPNGQRSRLLGSMWRDLSDVDKDKYYRDSEALQQLHKEIYPEYVYSPLEARIRKQIRTENKLKSKHALRLQATESTPTSVASSGEGKENKNLQEMESIDVQSNNGGIEEENNCKAPKRALNERPANLPIDPFQSPLYYPNGWEKRIPLVEHSGPCCICTIHGFNRRYVENSQSPLTSKENPPSSSTGQSKHESIPTMPNAYCQPFHHLFKNNFYPAVWNPWVMWPGPYYSPTSGVNAAGLNNNFARSYPPSSTRIEKPVSRRSSVMQSGPSATVTHSSSTPFDQFPTVPNIRSSCASVAQHSIAREDDLLCDEGSDGNEFGPLVIDDDIGDNSCGELE